MLPAQDRLEAFRNLVCSSKIGTAGVAEDAAEVHIGFVSLTALGFYANCIQYIQNDFVNQRKVNSDNTPSTSAAASSAGATATGAARAVAGIAIS